MTTSRSCVVEKKKYIFDKNTTIAKKKGVEAKNSH